jgi:hypothetical protein
VVIAAQSLAAWLEQPLLPADSQPWLTAAPVVAALLAAVVTWPSTRQAALTADRRLGLDDRLGTAYELMRGRLRPGRFDRLQLDDALVQARRTPVRWLALDARVRRDAFIAAAALGLALLSLLLPAVPRPSLAPPAGSVSIAPPETEIPSDALARANDTEVVDLAAPLAQPVTQSAVDADLAARVQQEQAERDALDRLSQALSRISAGQPAADAIQRGDFSQANQQLAALGEEADQLSDVAKQQLSQALQQAANNTAATDRQLADRERQAAQALAHTGYGDQRQALRSLGEQVERSGARSASPDQLARDTGRLQQQTGAPQASQSAAARSPAADAGPQSQGAPTGTQAAQGNEPGAAAPGATEGQQGGPGAGTGAGTGGLGDTPANLDSAGQNVEVPTRLGTGPGVRPTDGTEDQAMPDPATGSRSVAELVQTQQTGQVVPEQNLVPGEQRPVVRGYFK